MKEKKRLKHKGPGEKSTKVKGGEQRKKMRLTQWSRIRRDLEILCLQVGPSFSVASVYPELRRVLSAFSVSSFFPLPREAGRGLAGCNRLGKMLGGT
jgi:hypothetical protein